MNLKPLNSAVHVQASQLPLEMLAGNPNVSDADKVAEVARQFEAVLLRQILSEASKPAGDGKGVASSIYNDMVNTQLADSISRSGNFGLANALKGQLTHQTLPHAERPAPGLSKLLDHSIHLKKRN